MRRRSRIALIAMLSAAHPGLVAAGPHPSLLIDSQSIRALRQRCAGAPSAANSAAPQFERLRSSVSARPDSPLLEGELLAAAFITLMSDAPDPATRALLNDSFRHPQTLVLDELEQVIALDWAWDRLEADARREFLIHARQRARPLATTDTPLDHRTFRSRLASLALAIAVDEQDDPGPTWRGLRSRILAAGSLWLRDTLPVFVEQRGLAPTSPITAGLEESDIVLAIELGGLLDDGPAWNSYRGSVGRWLEHYVFETTPHQRMRRQMPHDDASSAPELPSADWTAAQPLTAFLLAARTADPAAAVAAHEITRRLQASRDPAIVPWSWAPILLDVSDRAACDLERLPLGRNLLGALALRSGSGPGHVVTWIESTQPILTRDQHFDAGNFLIAAGGSLVVNAGDPVASQALPSAGGKQGLGKRTAAFDFQQFNAATISHNCMIFWEPALASRWRDAVFLPQGGQRPIDTSLADGNRDREKEGRMTPQLLAWNLNRSCAYAALDLGPAYDSRLLKSYTREFVSLWGKTLVVIDRAVPAPRVLSSWILNIPRRPVLNARPLSSSDHVGPSEDRGYWDVAPDGVLSWRNGDGTAWFQSIAPAERRVRVVGGPARTDIVPAGPFAGRPYVGGSPDSFERLILPSGRPQTANAWYRLGSPDLLGANFGETCAWGRIEVEPGSSADELLFVNLVSAAVASDDGPEVRAIEEPDLISLTLNWAGRSAQLIIPRGARGGRVELGGPAASSVEWSQTIADDPPLELAGP